MDSFHQPAYGLRSQFTVKAMAKKMAKSIVGKSIRGNQRTAPNVLPVASAERAPPGREGPQRSGAHGAVTAALPQVSLQTHEAGGDPGPWARVRQASALGLQRLNERRQHLVHVVF